MRLRSAALAIQANETFKPTYLSVPPSPHDPRSPVSPLVFRTNRGNATVNKTTTIVRFSDPPEKPLNWIWVCHLCRTPYILGVTRRCLEDGHYFCPGTTPIKSWRANQGRSKKVRKHKACSSEFDYQGWKKWGNWRQNEHAMFGLEGQTYPTPPLTKKQRRNCWDACDFPSECRWGPNVHSQLPSPPASSTLVAMRPPTSEPSELETMDMTDSPLSATDFDSESTPTEDIFITMTLPKIDPAINTDDSDFTKLLEASTERRNRRNSDSSGATKSPLSAPLAVDLQPIEEENMSDNQGAYILAMNKEKSATPATDQSITAPTTPERAYRMHMHAEPRNQSSSAPCLSPNTSRSILESTVSKRVFTPRTTATRKRNSVTSLGTGGSGNDHVNNPIRQPDLQIPTRCTAPFEERGAYTHDLGSGLDGMSDGISPGREPEARREEERERSRGPESFGEMLKRKGGVSRLFG